MIITTDRHLSLYLNKYNIVILSPLSLVAVVLLLLNAITIQQNINVALARKKMRYRNPKYNTHQSVQHLVDDTKDTVQKSYSDVRVSNNRIANLYTNYVIDLNILGPISIKYEPLKRLPCLINYDLVLAFHDQIIFGENQINEKF